MEIKLQNIEIFIESAFADFKREAHNRWEFLLGLMQEGTDHERRKDNILAVDGLGAKVRV